MRYETIISISDCWCAAIDDFVEVDVYFIIKVDEFSFSHDWHHGGVETFTDCEVEYFYYGFQFRGRAVLFDPESGHRCLVDIDEYQLEILKEDAKKEALQNYDTPEWLAIYDRQWEG